MADCFVRLENIRGTEDNGLNGFLKEEETVVGNILVMIVIKTLLRNQGEEKVFVYIKVINQKSKIGGVKTSNMM